MNIKQIIWDILEWLTNLPTGFGILLRNFVYPLFIKMPLGFSKRKMVKIYKGVRITDPFNLQIGEGSSIHVGCVFLSGGTILIGKNVLIAPNCVFASHQHTYLNRDTLIYDQPMKEDPIVINDNVWFGACCIILPGVVIGKGSIIGAGSVVTKNVPEMRIWAGNPAKELGRR